LAASFGASGPGKGEAARRNSEGKGRETKEFATLMEIGLKMEKGSILSS